MQTTHAQTAASRQNATHSTGPRTAAGKSTSAQNSTTHGLTATLRAELEPDNEHESFLVNQMIEARWRLARMNRLEAAAFDAILAPGPATTPDAQIVAHMAAAERSYHRAHRELLYTRRTAQAMTQKVIDNYMKNVIFAPPPTQPQPAPAADSTMKGSPVSNPQEHGPYDNNDRRTQTRP